MADVVLLLVDLTLLRLGQMAMVSGHVGDLFLLDFILRLLESGGLARGKFS